MQKYTFLFISALFLVLSCGRKKNNTPEAAIKVIGCEFCLDSTDFEQLTLAERKDLHDKMEAYYDQRFDGHDFNGSFLIAKKGHIIFERYAGYRSYKNDRKITSTTPLHLASVGKVLTAAAVFRLIDKKKLGLDDKVQKILPQLPYSEVTIRMLLNHRSGIKKYSLFSEPDSIWGNAKVLRNKDILKILSKHKIPLDFQPDTKFTYCNTNYALLALVVEKITQMSFAKAMDELVFSPLGMNHSFVFNLEKDKYKVSQSYKSRFQIIPFDHLDAVYGDKNIYSTPRDLLKFDLAMQKDDFISEKLKQQIFQGYSYEKAGVKNYGLGIRIKEWAGGERIFYHNGWWHGNTSAYISLKKEGVTLIAISSKYSRKVYDIIRLSAYFGNYPFGFEDSFEDSSVPEILSESKTDSAEDKAE